jgi:hypothetical protein
MKEVRLSAHPKDLGWLVTASRPSGVFRRAVPLSASEWEVFLQGGGAGSGLLSALLDSGKALRSSEGITIAHAIASSFSEAEAALLGFPSGPPFALKLSHDGAFGAPGFSLSISWIARDGLRASGVRRSGSLLQHHEKAFLLRGPLYELLSSIDVANEVSAHAGDDRSKANLDALMVKLSIFKSALTSVTGRVFDGVEISADNYINELMIFHANAISVEAVSVGTNDVFVPKLRYSSSTSSRSEEWAADEVEAGEEEVAAVLFDNDAKFFETERFASVGPRSHYSLGKNKYVVLDRQAVIALEVLQRVNASDKETKRRFMKDPISFLIGPLESEGFDGSVLVECVGYGDRVLGCEEWTPPQFSFKADSSRSWFVDDGSDSDIAEPEPEQVQSFVVRSFGGERHLSLADAESFLQAFEAAEIAGFGSFQFGDEVFPLDDSCALAVEKMRSALSSASLVEMDRSVSDDEAFKSRRMALVVAGNEEELTYQVKMEGGTASLLDVDGIKTRNKPKKHQRDGIAWLQGAVDSGMRGVLLADDMGLGKTFQVLAFLKWRRDRQVRGRSGGPVMIVAPKTLLGNWLDEVDEHLGRDALGQVLKAYGSDLDSLKRFGKVGSDVKLGTQTLDRDRLSKADWILTTYETLRDYQFSFAAIPFSIIVYDEAQKVKTPGSAMTTAAKAQQARFTIVMTGTPVENSLLDLWTLMDLCWPGFLSFTAKEAANGSCVATEEQRGLLRESLVFPYHYQGRKLVQPVMLRRFKKDVIEGLPERFILPRRMMMPELQANAYSEVLRNLSSAPKEKGAALKALQKIRMISLHPNLRMPLSASEHEKFIAESARFMLLFEILDAVKAAGAKALVFIDLREAQNVLMELIAHRYRPKNKTRVINGAVSADQRTEIKNTFQKNSGFELLLLSPKAAGFGLTLTAATHVVHLNRWWNPAVEDQCTDRIYRIGQEEDVSVHLPMAIHPALKDASFDVILDGMLDEKRELSSEIVIPTSFTEDDLRQLHLALVSRAA